MAKIMVSSFINTACIMTRKLLHISVVEKFFRPVENANSWSIPYMGHVAIVLPVYFNRLVTTQSKLHLMFYSILYDLIFAVLYLSIKPTCSPSLNNGSESFGKGCLCYSGI